MKGSQNNATVCVGTCTWVSGGVGAGGSLFVSVCVWKDWIGWDRGEGIMASKTIDCI